MLYQLMCPFGSWWKHQGGRKVCVSVSQTINKSYNNVYWEQNWNNKYKTVENCIQHSLNKQNIAAHLTKLHYKHSAPKTHLPDGSLNSGFLKKIWRNFISHTTNVLLFKCLCNIFVGVRIIKEMQGSVASGTHCTCNNCGCGLDCTDQLQWSDPFRLL
jgi:hypothetical protein